MGRSPRGVIALGNSLDNLWEYIGAGGATWVESPPRGQPAPGRSLTSERHGLSLEAAPLRLGRLMRGLQYTHNDVTFQADAHHIFAIASDRGRRESGAHSGTLAAGGRSDEPQSVALCLDPGRDRLVHSGGRTVFGHAAHAVQGRRPARRTARRAPV